MFNTATRTQFWGIEGYEVPVNHVDAAKQVISKFDEIDQEFYERITFLG